MTEGELDLTTGVPPRAELPVVLGADGGQIEGVVENVEPEPAASAVVTSRLSAATVRYRSTKT